MAIPFVTLAITDERDLNKCFGRLCFASVVVIFFTAQTVALIKFNIFLLLVVTFFFYAVFQELAFSNNRRGRVRVIDWFGIR